MKRGGVFLIKLPYNHKALEELDPFPFMYSHSPGCRGETLSLIRAVDPARMPCT